MIRALIRANLLELVRSRIYLTALGMLVSLVLLSALLDELATGEEGRVVVDVGLWVGSLAIDAVAIVLGLSSAANLQSVEVLLLLTRPITRTQVLLGRFSAVAVVVVAAAFACGATLCVLGWWAGSTAVARIPLATVLVAVEGVVVTAVAFAVGVSMSAAAASVAAFLLMVVGRLGDLLIELATAGKFGDGGVVLQGIARVIPQLWRFDPVPWVTSAATLQDVGMTLAYGALVIAGVLGLTSFIYQRRALG